MPVKTVAFLIWPLMLLLLGSTQKLTCNLTRAAWAQMD
jgi:hypothetical protein